jgi:acyl carrier protein
MDDKVIGRRETRSILATILSKEIIVKELGADEAEVTPGALFVEDLGANPWDLVELFMALEEAFEIKIPDNVAERLRTVKHAVNFIVKHAPGCERWFPWKHGSGQTAGVTLRDYD